jgi:diadenosine hexaphosphate hydrolase (ATP-forming)
MKRSDISSGGVVFFENSVLILQYKDGTWTFPKGHLEVGETEQQAAEREVLEEAGVRAKSLERIGETRYINNRGEAREVRWFTMNADVESIKLESTFMNGGFFTLERAGELLSFPEDRDLLERAVLSRNRAKGQNADL